MATITLGSIHLDGRAAYMVWVDRYHYSPVVQDVQTTLGGSPVVYTGNRTAGRPITLVAIDDQGWLTKAQVDAVQISAQQAGAIFTLIIGSETFQVMFRHHEPPAVEMQPIIPRGGGIGDTGDYYVGTIKLMTV